MLHDLRYGFRSLIRNPGFTAIAVLCLAVAIAANSTIFSLVDGYTLRPLPVEEPDGLVRVFTATDEHELGRSSYRDLMDFRESVSALGGLAGFQYRGFVIEDDEPAMPTNTHVVTGNYFDLLGVKPLLGRFIQPADEEEPVVVISHNLWQRRYGGDEEVIGRQVLIVGQPCTVIGVTRPGFQGAELGRDPDIWIPAGNPRFVSTENRHDRSFDVVGRLRPDASLDSARAEIAAVARNLERAYPDTNKGRRAVAMSETEFRLRNSQGGFVLMGVVALVLLIACANVANLLLARAEQRRREIAIRLSLGSSRGRLVRGLLAEGTLLAGLGTAAGLLMAWWLIAALPWLVTPPSTFRSGHEFRLDERVLIFTLIVAASTVLVFALAPALRATRMDLTTALKGLTPRPIFRGRTFGPRSELLAVQVAVSVVLLVGTGLLVKAFLANLHSDFGFSERNLVVAEVVHRRPPQQGDSFWRELRDRIQAMPGVEGTAYALRAPLTGSGGGLAAEVRIPGYEMPPGVENLRIMYGRVTADYFQTLGIRLLRGRLFADDGREEPSVVINETMARRYFPGGDAIDKLIHIDGRQAEGYRVVGIVADTKINHVGELAAPYFYVPFPPGFGDMRALLVETNGDAAARAELVRSQILNLDSRTLIYSLTTIGRIIQTDLHEQRVSASAIAILGLLSMLLAAGAPARSASAWPSALDHATRSVWCCVKDCAPR